MRTLILAATLILTTAAIPTAAATCNPTGVVGQVICSVDPLVESLDVPGKIKFASDLATGTYGAACGERDSSGRDGCTQVFGWLPDPNDAKDEAMAAAREIMNLIPFTGIPSGCQIGGC